MMFVGAFMEVRSGRGVGRRPRVRGLGGGAPAVTHARRMLHTFACVLPALSRGRGVACARDRVVARSAGRPAAGQPPARDCCCGFGKRQVYLASKPARRRAAAST